MSCFCGGVVDKRLKAGLIGMKVGQVDDTWGLKIEINE